MENLDYDNDAEEEKDNSISEDDDKDKLKDGKNNKLSTNIEFLPKLDSENVILHPIFILEQAFSKVKAVGSSTALVAIRN